MYKSIRARVLACLVVVIVLSLSVLPLMASASDPLEGGDRWGQETPDFSNLYTLTLADFSRAGIESLTEGINYAYGGGMFGGSIPIAIVATRQNRITYIDVITLSQIATPDQQTMESKEIAIESTTCTIDKVNQSIANIIFTAERNTYPGAKLTTFRICQNGDLMPLEVVNAIQRTYFEDFDNYGSGCRLLAIRTGYFENRFDDDDPSSRPTNSTGQLTSISGDWYISQYWPAEQYLPNHWFEPAKSTPATDAFEQWAERLEIAYAVNGSVWDDGYNDGYDDGYDDGVLSGYQNGYNQGLTEGEELGFTEGHEQGYQSGYDNGYDAGYDPGYRQGYDDGYTEGVASVPPVVLDIPSIFTAMFSGVHSIFQGFDINIFGISIAGMLLGILLVVFVAFVVKKLK